MKRFTVKFWSNVFSILGWISPFRIICLIPWIPRHPKEGYNFFVEVYALANVLLSIVLLLICSAPSIRLLEALAIIWGAIHIFEVIIKRITEVLFEGYTEAKKGGTYVVHGFLRKMILSLYNYVEIIFWFALFYRNFDWAFETGKTTLDSFLVSLNFSFVTMTTFGYSAIFPKETLGIILTLIQSVIGLLMVLLILARFISLLPPIQDLGESEEQ